MHHRSEELDQKRARLLIAFAVTYAIWQSATIAGEWLPTGLTGDWVNGIKAFAGLAGLVWVWFALRVFQLIRVIRSNSSLAAALNDERVRNARYRAAWTGLITIICTLIVMRLATMLWPWLHGQLLVDLLLLVAVLSTIIAFIVHDRD